MSRTAKQFPTVLALALAATGLRAAPAAAQGKPVVAVLYFDNNSIGKDRADYEGLGKGIADMLITDLAANPNLAVVERESIQQLLTEQNLTKTGVIDPQTAIRLGKIIGAQYMITGGFMNDGRGHMVLTARTIDVTTSKIENPIKLTGTGDDVLGFVGQLSQRVSELKLQPVRVGDAGAAAPSAKPAAQPAAEPAKQPAVTQAAAAQPAAQPASKPAKLAPRIAPTHVAQAQAKKMDIHTAILYAKALDEKDHGNKAKAITLFNQVLEKMPDYQAARANLAKLSN